MPERPRYAVRRAAGLCVSCGTGKPTNGRTRCDECRAVAREAAANRRAFADLHNLCEACMRRPRDEGRGNRCDECADRYLERQRDRERAKQAG